MDRINYLLVKEAKIIAMTCTHAALRRKDFVELSFKVMSAAPPLVQLSIGYYPLPCCWMINCSPCFCMIISPSPLILHDHKTRPSFCMMISPSPYMF